MTRHRRYRRWTDQAFVGALGARRTAALRAHLEGCDDCRDYYDQLGYADRALSPGPMSPAAIDRIGRIGRIILSEPDPPRRTRWVWGGAAATVAAVAVLLLLVLPRQRVAQPDLQPRGVRDQPLMPGERQPGVRLFCVADGARVLDESRAVEPGVTAEPLGCILDGELQLVYSTPGLEGLTMAIFSRDDRGRTFWYAPVSAGAETVELTADAVDEPLSWSTRLDPRHEPGTYELEVMFFRRPVVAEAAEAGLVEPIYRLQSRMVIAPRNEVSP